MSRSFLFLLLTILSFRMAISQNQPFALYLEPMNLTGLGGLQSFAFGQDGGKWLIVGGRLDGLHRRQPFASFDLAGNNNKLIVVDVAAQKIWKASLSSLPLAIREHLSSTNMEFHQEGEYLYVLGGYGYQSATASKITFDKLTAIHLPSAIKAVTEGSDLNPSFRQVSDSRFAVTGGHLKKINDTWYLLGGNKFDGNYNPMGHNTFTQVYTDAIRKFKIADDGKTILVSHLPGHTDPENLHRRDYNAVPQIMPDGSEGITMFSGVFQPGADLPFLNCVNVDSTSYQADPGFKQYYNHYHCAVLPVYSESENEMHNVFFGGIAQYYDSAGLLVRNDNVPFVKTIARVSRNTAGIMTEHKLPVEMPGYLGAGAEFIPVEDIPQFENGVLKLDQLPKDSMLVGYIFGGINSTDRNIFFINTGAESMASGLILKVFLIPDKTSENRDIPEKGNGDLHLKLMPNPSKAEFSVQFHLKQAEDLTFSIHAMDGQLIFEEKLKKINTGENTYSPSIKDLNLNGTYLVTLQSKSDKASQILSVRP